MSNEFRALLCKIGSGPHTGEDLSREEAAAAMEMLLREDATPAQIGAFLIAHRMKRPTGAELAGMLDGYQRFGPRLQALPSGAFATDRVTVLGTPYDGRSRTVPVTILVGLMLAAVGYPVILHGGDRMPTKYGTPLVEFWRGLGVNWSSCLLSQVQEVFNRTGVGFVYTPMHFPLAWNLVPYREQVGKRPPLATLELFWPPYGGAVHLAIGYVHPPTEGLIREALGLHGLDCYSLVKGLEGSCDLPRSRTAIIGLSGQVRGCVNGESVVGAFSGAFERLSLHPREFGLGGSDVVLESDAQGLEAMWSVLQGRSSPLTPSVIWNGGFYLWRCGVCGHLGAGLAEAERLLVSGEVVRQLKDIQGCLADVTSGSPVGLM